MLTAGKRQRKPSKYNITWTPEEDALLLGEVEKHGSQPDSWVTVAIAFDGTRESKQCRERWMEYIDPTLYKGPFSPEEDEALLQHQSNMGNQWKVQDIATALSADFPRRSGTAIKVRYYALENRRRKDVLHAIEHGDLDDEVHDVAVPVKRKRRAPKKKMASQFAEPDDDLPDTKASKDQRFSPRGAALNHSSSNSSDNDEESHHYSELRHASQHQPPVDYSYVPSDQPTSRSTAYSSMAASSYPNLSILSSAAAAMSTSVPPPTMSYPAPMYAPIPPPQYTYYPYPPYGMPPAYPTGYPAYGQNNYYYSDPRQSNLH